MTYIPVQTPRNNRDFDRMQSRISFKIKLYRFALGVSLLLLVSGLYLFQDARRTEALKEDYVENGFYLDQINVPPISEWQTIDGNRTFIDSVESKSYTGPWSTLFSANEADNGSVKVTIFFEEPAPLYNALMPRWNGRRYASDRHFGLRTIVRMRLVETSSGGEIVASGVAPDHHNLTKEELGNTHEFTRKRIWPR
jgi:hypothetical protein